MTEPHKWRVLGRMLMFDLTIIGACTVLGLGFRSLFNYSNELDDALRSVSMILLGSSIASWTLVRIWKNT